MRRRVIREFQKQGKFLSPEAVDYLFSQEKPMELVRVLAGKCSDLPLFIGISHIKNLAHDIPTPGMMQKKMGEEQQNPDLLCIAGRHRINSSETGCTTGAESTMSSVLPVGLAETEHRRAARVPLRRRGRRGGEGSAEAARTSVGGDVEAQHDCGEKAEDGKTLLDRRPRLASLGLNLPPSLLGARFQG